MIAEVDLLNRKICFFTIFDFLESKSLLKMNLLSKKFYNEVLPIYMKREKKYCNTKNLKYLYSNADGNLVYGVQNLNSEEPEDFFQLKNKLFSLK